MEYTRLKDTNLEEHINSRVYIIFMARDVSIRTQKDGVTKFISLHMYDKGVNVEAKKFGATETEINTMINGGVYCAAVNVEPYVKSATGYSCNLYNFDTFDMNPNEFIEWAEHMPEAYTTIQHALETISESIYRDLVYNILTANWQQFCTWSAASSMHHTMMGGLLVHTAEVIEQSKQIGELWNNKYGPSFINMPLLLSGALLHDIAKTQELDVDTANGTTAYSTRACLETHITMCISMIDTEAAKLNLGQQVYKINEVDEQEPIKSDEDLEFEKEAVSLLKHLILSHHGKKEYGSPIEPNCPEAYILNLADLLSAEMFRYNKTFNQMEPGTSQSTWLGGNMVCTYKDSTK